MIFTILGKLIEAPVLLCISVLESEAVSLKPAYLFSRNSAVVADVKRIFYYGRYDLKLYVHGQSCTWHLNS